MEALNARIKAINDVIVDNYDKLVKKNIEFYVYAIKHVINKFDGLSKKYYVLGSGQIMCTYNVSANKDKIGKIIGIKLDTFNFTECLSGITGEYFIGDMPDDRVTVSNYVDVQDGIKKKLESEGVKLDIQYQSWNGFIIDINI